MPPDRARLPGGYLTGLLADGAVAFAPRTRVHRLLGVPASEGGGASFLPPLPPVGFQYASPGPGGPGFGPSPHGPPAPLADPSSRAAMNAPARRATPRDVWDWDHASHPAAAPRADAPRAEPAPRPSAIDRPAPARDVRAADAGHPASRSLPAESPLAAETRPAPRGGAARAAEGKAVEGKPGEGKRTEGRTADASSATLSTKPAVTDAHRPESGAGEAKRETKPVPPARTVGLTVPGISGPREILAALAQREASARAPDLRRPRAEPAAPAAADGAEQDAAPSAPRPASAARRPTARRTEAAPGTEDADHHPPPTPSPVPPRTPSPAPRPQAAGRTPGAGVEQLRRAMATRARQAAPVREEPAPAAPPPAPVIVQAAPQPVVVVQAPGGLEATAPRAFLSSSLLRGSHLRVLR